MDVKIHQQIADIPRLDWNRLVADNNPLVSHEFLLAMEQNNCVGEAFGWLPHHLAVYDRHKLIAAMPLYLKMNSYGEFVFDHSWAEAYQRSGLQYFPKLVSAVPYTPAIGQRLLCETGREAELFPLVLKVLMAFATENQFSGFHCLFPTEKEMGFFTGNGFLTRHDCQYHWFNHDYQHFDDFLSSLISRKRKNIRKERDSVKAQGITVRRLNGHSATEQDWQHFAYFYKKTFVEKWGMATFNQDFFMQVAKQLPDNILLVMADRDETCIAGALMYVSGNRLYGRHWGCTEKINNLHFELCYYQGIEFCIEHQLDCFEPGAQGEHKVARGFIPVMTASAHWLASPEFQEPVKAFCLHEKQAVEEYIDDLNLFLNHVSKTVNPFSV